MLKDANIYDGEKIAKPIEKEIFTRDIMMSQINL